MLDLIQSECVLRGINPTAVLVTLQDGTALLGVAHMLLL
jgi:hypothetical protein